MRHRPARMEPPPCTAETVAREKRQNHLSFQTVVAAQAYEHYRRHWPQSAHSLNVSYFELPKEVRERFDRIALVLIGMLDPMRESLARVAAMNAARPIVANTNLHSDEIGRLSALAAVNTYLAVLEQTVEADRPEVPHV